jgi:hypothetical protein
MHVQVLSYKSFACSMQDAWPASNLQNGIALAIVNNIVKMRVMTTKLTRLTQKMGIQWHLVEHSRITCLSHSYRWVWKHTDMPFLQIYISHNSEKCSAPQLKQTIHNCINTTTLFHTVKLELIQCLIQAGIAVSTVIRLWAGWQTNHCSIPGRGKRFSTPKNTDQL